VAQVAERLGNTPAICRRCYIHPDVIAAYEAGELALGSHADQSEEDPLTLDKAERAVLRFLKSGGTSAA
jgi:DNA topoisomerase-1